jgi:DNA invertase Pin-like site-specific DNA recombinase
MKVGIYSRVSTEEQKTKGVSLDDQRKRGVEFCERNNYQYEIFDDGGYSGELSIQERPGLNRLLEQIYLEEIQGIYVVDFDRITRDEKDGFVIKKTLIDSKIKLFDTSGEINLNDETQDLLLGIKILLSSFELKKLRVRIKRSLERSVSEGRAGGGPLINYGFQKEEETKQLIINDIEADVVRFIYQLSIEGKGTKVIAEILNQNEIPTKRSSSKKGYLKVRGELKSEFIWRDSVVYRILTNPLYKGVRMYKGKEYSCPQIIEPQKFDLVQRLLKERTNLKDTTNKYFYLLKGKVFCAECNSRFYGRKREDLSDNQYICSSQRYKGGFCGTRGINIDYLDELILKQLLTVEKDVEEFFNWYGETDQIKMTMMKAKKARELEKKATDQIENLLDVYTEGNLKKEFFNKKLEILNKTLENAQKDKGEALYQLSFMDKKEDVIRVIKEHIEGLKKEDLDPEIKRNIVRSLVDKIYVMWIPNMTQHIITIDLKIDQLTQYQLNKSIDIKYKMAGSRMTERNIFRQQLKIRKLFSDMEGEPMTSIDLN